MIFFHVLSAGNVSERSVRLLGGENSQEGIVEVAYDGRWGMICDDRFSSTDARSVCEGLGFNRDDASLMSLSSLRYIIYMWLIMCLSFTDCRLQLLLSCMCVIFIQPNLGE